MKRLACLSLLIASACSDSQVHDRFNVISDGAVIPVAVHGDGSSGTLILFESGGPAGPSIAERLVDIVDFKDTLEQEVLVAYYDRRGVGNAHGSYDADDLTVDALIGDLEAVRLVLEERYAPSTIVLMGHSFGSLLSGMYLAEHPDSFDVWIPTAPGWTIQDEDMQVYYRYQWGCRVSRDFEAEGASTSNSKKMLNFCEDRDSVNVDDEDIDEFYDLIAALDEDLDTWPGVDAGKATSAALFSQYNLLDTQLRGNRISDRIWSDLEGVDAIAGLRAIELPTLIVTSEHDVTAPTELALDGLNALGTPDSQKALLELPNAGHYPFHVQPELFAQEVMAFIETHGSHR